MNTLLISDIQQDSVPLTGAWHFSVDQEQRGEQQGWMDPGFDDASWIAVDVPHTWNVMPEYSERVSENLSK